MANYEAEPQKCGHLGYYEHWPCAPTGMCTQTIKPHPPTSPTPNTHLQFEIFIPECQRGPSHILIPSSSGGVKAPGQTLPDLLVLLFPRPVPVGHIGKCEVLHPPLDLCPLDYPVRHHLVLLEPPLWEAFPSALNTLHHHQL